MSCCKKNNYYSESLLNNSLINDIELQPYKVDKSDQFKYEIKKEVPWQFFLDTHTNRYDIGWWKKK